MMMNARLATIFCSLIFGINALAQLSPPGLGETKTAFWSAIGVKQQLNEKNSSTTYIGTGRISGEESDNPFSNPSILVLNEEIYHKLNPSWQYSYALSYRRQHEYDEGFDVPESAEIKQEFRVYARLGYTSHIGNLKWTTTLRQEARKFYSHDFTEVPDGFQLRTRLKTQLFIPLDIDGQHSLMGSAEALFAMANDSDEGWGSPNYKEARFCLYYTFAPNNLNMVFDIGYMNDLIGNGNDMADAGYLAIDIVIKNPFSHS